jgi:flagellar export protein FliJ
MKKFTFTLDRVREWRERQAALEEARLEKLFAERTFVEHQRDLLEGEVLETATAVAHASAVTSVELTALDEFRRYAAAQRPVFARKLADCDARIAAQRQALTEAKRRFELLDHLRSKKRNKWNKEFAREIEMQASESFLAKWSGERR